jgi:ketosteroid isomerase-like protein
MKSRMPVRILLTFSLIFIFAIAVSGSQKSRHKSANEAPEKAILTVLNQQVAAWNRHDLEGFMAGYRNSDKLTFFSGGTKTMGWSTTLERYRARYKSNGNEMGQLDFTDIEVESLGPQSAFVRGHWHLKMANGEPGGLFTLIFRKFSDGWKIIHDHTSSAS